MGALKKDAKVVTTHVILELMPTILSKTIFTYELLNPRHWFGQMEQARHGGKHKRLDNDDKAAGEARDFHASFSTKSVLSIETLIHCRILE